MAPVVIDLSRAEDLRDVVHRAVQALVEGKVVALPTETVYVVAASALNDQAVRRLAELAGRNQAEPLTLAIRSTDEAFDFVPQMSLVGMRIARRCWPGPLTLELPDNQPESAVQRLSPYVKQQVAPAENVRLRVPGHELVLNILRMVAGPVVVTAAAAGGVYATTGGEVTNLLGDAVDLVLDDGPCRYGQASTVLRVVGDNLTLLREGVITHSHVKRLASWMVVLVCTGNTCRSPMAEALFRKQLADKLGCKPDELLDRGAVVLSAGVAASPGGRCTPEAADVMKERGLDLSLHESQPLNERLVRFADLILTMTRSHREAILQTWPEVADRTFVVSRGRGDVSDPIGGPVELYRRCAEQIDGHLSTWLETLELDDFLPKNG